MAYGCMIESIQRVITSGLVILRIYRLTNLNVQANVRVRVQTKIWMEIAVYIWCDMRVYMFTCMRKTSRALRFFTLLFVPLALTFTPEDINVWTVALSPAKTPHYGRSAHPISLSYCVKSSSRCVGGGGGRWGVCVCVCMCVCMCVCTS
jgi:hypothetical protein